MPSVKFFILIVLMLSSRAFIDDDVLSIALFASSADIVKSLNLFDESLKNKEDSNDEFIFLCYFLYFAILYWYQKYFCLDCYSYL